MRRLGVAGTALVATAAVEIALGITGRTLLSKRRGLVRAAVFAVWGGIGAHLAIEAVEDHIVDAMARSFS